MNDQRGSGESRKKINDAGHANIPALETAVPVPALVLASLDAHISLIVPLLVCMLQNFVYGRVIRRKQRQCIQVVKEVGQPETTNGDRYDYICPGQTQSR